MMAIAGGGMIAAFLVLWFVQRRTRDASAVDALWALGIATASLYYALSGPGDARGLLAGLLVCIWGVRLGLHLLVDRVLMADHEDSRYAAMRVHYGPQADRHFLWFFMAQAVACFVFSLPALALVHDPRPLVPTDAVWVVWWAVTLVMVAVADRQLAAFRADPSTRGTTCRRGLWRFSRHPNYFFEWLHWFSYVGLAWGGPFHWWLMLAPAVLFVLLIFVTGIPYAEARSLESRSDYASYRASTSAFIPWFPKS
jgi:steroid 5-alpha reductase family enzyme